jgi:hypothetical protein
MGQPAVTDEHVDRFMPSGRFKALPQFTANIATNDGFLKYDYGLAISWKVAHGPRFSEPPCAAKDRNAG